MGQRLQVAIGTTVARLACFTLFAIVLAGGCGGGAGTSPVALAGFQRRALAAISQVTNAGTGYRGHAVLHLRMGMPAKGKAAAAVAVTLSRLRPPGSARSLNEQIVGVLWKLHRDFARAGRLGVAAALGTDAVDVQRLISLRSAVSAVPPY